MKQLVVVLALLALSYLTVQDLMIPGGFTSHDLTHHIIRQIEMGRLLSDGQIPPRWADQLNKGFGYPVFLFNYPLPPLVGEIFVKSGWSFVESLKWVFGLSLMVSVVGMYLFIRSLVSDKYSFAAFLGATFYLFAPIRFSTVYVSAAVGSAVGLGVVPWVFWATNRLIQTGSMLYLLIGSLGLGLLITAHNVTTLMFLPVLGLFIAIQLFSHLAIQRISIARSLTSLIAMILLGFGLSAWFWLPSLVEKEFIIYDTQMAGFYRDQFPTLQQLISSPWGYGFSKPGVDEDGMSFQIGYLQLLAISLLAVSLWWFRQDRRFLALAGFSLVVFMISVLLMLDQSIPIWDTIPLLSYIQFPWRILSVAVFAASIAAALIVTWWPFKRLLFLLLLVGVVYANRNHWQINQSTDDSEAHYRSLQTTTAAFDEHLPKWGKRMGEVSSMKYQVLRGEGTVEIIEDKSQRVVAKVQSEQDLTVRFNQFYFPGWEIKVDGQRVDFDYLMEGENYGLPVFRIPEGGHFVQAEFTNTPIRSLADGISLLSAVIIILMGLSLGVRRVAGRTRVFSA